MCKIQGDTKELTPFATKSTTPCVTQIFSSR